MFIVRYLMAAVVVVTAIVVWGIAAGYSFWTITGFAVLATVVLQVLILAYVILAAARNGRDPARDGHAQPAQLVILPR